MWTEKTFAELGYTYTGLSGKNKASFGSGEPYIPYMNVFGNESVDTEAFEYVQIKKGERQNTVAVGDALFTTSSETPEEVGMSSVLTEDFGVVYLNSFCFGLRLYRPTDFDSKFLSYVLRSKSIRKQMFIAAQGSTRHNLSKQNFNRMKLRYPIDTKEQHNIAAVLTSTDEAIEASRALVKKFTVIKQGLMQDLFSMSEQVRLDSGIVQINPYCREKRPDLFYYIDLEAVIAGEITKEVIVSRNEAPSRAQRLLKPNDILFQMVRPYQQNNYLFRKERELKTVASTGYAQIRTDNNAVYMYYALHQNEFVREVNNRSTGSSYPAINPTELGKCSIRFDADRAKQDEIAQILTAADERLTTERDRLKKLENIKRGLMDDLLTNRISTDNLQGGV